MTSPFPCYLSTLLGFPDSSVGKESTCNAGDPSSIPGSGRSAGEGIGYPLQYSWVIIVKAQLLRQNLKIMPVVLCLEERPQETFLELLPACLSHYSKNCSHTLKKESERAGLKLNIKKN